MAKRKPKTQTILISKKLMVTIGIAFFVLVGVIIALFVTSRSKPTIPQETSQEDEIQEIVERVGKLILLPQGEEPTIATVTDTAKVKDQPFFKNAQNGDKVLVYVNQGKAILYRPKENIIVEVGSVNTNQEPQAIEEQQSPTPETRTKPTILTPTPSPFTPTGTE